MVKIIQVMPAMNAISEHAFSALRRMKSYLCTTMWNNRLNHLMICTVHKELVEELNFKQVTNDFVDRVERQVTNDFVDRVERRSFIFGHFST